MLPSSAVSRRPIGPQRRFLAVAALGAALLSAGSGCRNFAEPPPPSLAVSPLRLSFSSAADGQSPPTQALSIGQLGTGALRWTAQADAPWLSVSPDSGTAPSVVWIGATTAGLAAGSYTGTIAVSAAGPGAARVTVSVTLDLRLTPSLTGRWVGVGNTVNLAMTLADSNGSVTGLGTVSPNIGSVAIAGTHQGSVVSLTLTAQGGTVLTYAGSLVDDNAIVGPFGGSGVLGEQLTVFRQ